MPFGLLLGAYGLARQQDAVVQAALGMLVLSALAAAGTIYTGEGAERTVERLVAGIDHRAIHEHGEWADRSAWASDAVGVLALLALGLSRAKPLRRGMAVAAVALALVPAGLLAYAAHLGGEVRHTERSGRPVTEAPRAPVEHAARGEHEH